MIRASRIANDGDEEICTTAAKTDLDACLDACGVAPTPTCSETCEAKVAAKFKAMLARGAKAERANKRAQRMFRRCVKGCEPQ